MGTWAWYRRLSPEYFCKLQEDPAEAYVYFGLYDEDEASDAEINAYYALMDGLQDAGRLINIEKAWLPLYFVLTGDRDWKLHEVPPALANAVLGGTETEWEAGNGSVRFLMPPEVQATAAALTDFSEAEMQARLTPEAFRAADFGEWTLGDFQHIRDAFVRVRQFFADAARDGDVVLLSLD